MNDRDAHSRPNIEAAQDADAAPLLGRRKSGDALSLPISDFIAHSPDHRTSIARPARNGHRQQSMRE